MSSESTALGRLPWRRLTAEFAVIVAGVLVALAVDAAWASQDEDRRKASYLRQLEADLIVSGEALAAAIAADSVVRASADSLAVSINLPLLPEGDQLVAWLWGVTVPSEFYPSTGTIQALVQGGDLRLIRDPQLRSALLGYLSALEQFGQLFAGWQFTAVEAYCRLGQRINFKTQVEPPENRQPIDWRTLAAIPGVTSDIVQIRIAAGMRLALLREISASRQDLMVALGAL